jgi:hypothetical protein
VVGLEEYRRRHDIEQWLQALTAQERQLAAQTKRHADIARLGLGLEEFSRRISQGLEQATWEQRRQLIEWLVARVVITNGEVEIRYVIPTSPAAQTSGICHLRSDYRGHVWPHQGSVTCRHALRPMRPHLLRRHHVCRHRGLLARTMSPDPRLGPFGRWHRREHLQLEAGQLRSSQPGRRLGSPLLMDSSVRFLQRSATGLVRNFAVIIPAFSECRRGSLIGLWNA